MGNSPSLPSSYCIQFGYFLESTMVKTKLPFSFSIIVALSGVFVFIFLSAGLMNVRFISAKFDLCDAGSIKRSDSHSWVVTHTPLERY